MSPSRKYLESEIKECESEIESLDGDISDELEDMRKYRDWALKAENNVCSLEQQKERKEKYLEDLKEELFELENPSLEVN